MSGRLPTVLFVDDNADSLFILERLFEKANVKALIERASGGEEAIEYLMQHRDANPEKLPLFVLMDLKMPLRDGFETIAWIRQQPDFKDLIVIALSTSYEEVDVRRAYAAGADAYMAKFPAPCSIEAIFEAAQADRSSGPFRERVLPGILRPKAAGTTNTPFA